MEFIRKLCLAFTFIQIGTAYQIMETDRLFSVPEREKLTLPCTVSGSDWDGFAEPLGWFKIQDDGSNDDSREVAVSHASQLQGVFDDNKSNYEVKYANQGATREFNLELKAARPQESGRYTCRISDSVQVIYEVGVLDSIDSMLVYGVPDSKSEPMEKEQLIEDSATWQGQTTLEYNDNGEGFFACVAKGVYPAPIFNITIGENKIDGRNGFETISSMKWTGATLGLQMVESDAIYYTRSMPIDSTDDGKELVCSATVDGSSDAPKTARASLTIQAKPNITCSQDVATPRGTPNFAITCEVNVRKTPSKVEWYAKKTGEHVGQDDGRKGDFQVFMQSAGVNKFYVSLQISEVKVQYYQPYELTVEVTYQSGDQSPVVLGDSAEVTLIEGTGEVGGSATPVLSALLVLTTMTAIIHLW